MATSLTFLLHCLSCAISLSLSLLSSLVAIYRTSHPQTPGDNNSCTISLCVWLSIRLSASACYVYPTSSSLPAPSSPSICSFTLALFWSRADRNRKAPNFPREPPIGFMLIFLSSSFFKQHLFILNSWKYISRHYNANDGTHIFLRIVVVGVGVWMRRQMRVCMCFVVLNPSCGYERA